MKLTITVHAKKQLIKIPKTYQILIGQKIRKFASDIFFGEGKLRGYKNYYKVRVGVYRIIYIKFPDEVEVVLIGHRREIYKLLERI